jgi:hypothetical protein
MRWFCLVGVASVLAACATPEVQSQRLKDGSWSFTCQLPMDECVRRVQDNCRVQRYRILDGSSETKLRDVPPFEKAYHTTRLHLVCTDYGDEPLLSLDSKKDGIAKPAAPAPASKVCTSGETRACVGPGACKGGQACSPDGRGFGACDCGPPTPSPPGVESAPPTAPAETSSPPPPSPVP